MLESSTVIGKEQCPECMDESMNNRIMYEDGSSHCFKCEINWFPDGAISKAGKLIQKGDGSSPAIPDNSIEEKKSKELITNGEYCALTKRAITKETCEKFDVQVGLYCGEYVIIFNRYTDGVLSRQNIATSAGRYWVTGYKTTHLDMFGSNWFDKPSGRHLVIHEARLDAMSSQQVLSHMYHCTALDDGGSIPSLEKWLNQHSKQLMEYESIILNLDNDEVGNKAKHRFLELFPYGNIKIANMPAQYKDANEMLQAGKGEDLKWCIIRAESIKPSNVVTASDLKERALKKVEKGPSWPWKGLTETTHGMRPGSYFLYGPESTGKTEIVRQIVEHNLTEHQMLSAIFSFEQEPDDTLQRLAGSRIGKRVHVPTVEWTPEELEPHIDYFNEKVFFYEYKGVLKFDDIVRSIYYLALCKRVKFFVLDNLTAMLSWPYVGDKRVSENEYLSHVAITLKQIQKELKIILLLLGHNSNDNMSKNVYVSTSPKNPEAYNAMTAEDTNKAINKPGMTWESGRMATLENIYGSGTIKKVMDWVFAIARNRVSEDDMEHRTIRFKFLKTRLASENEGREIKLLYQYDSGQLIEIESNLNNAVNNTAKEVF